MYRTAEELPKSAILDLKTCLYQAAHDIEFNSYETYGYGDEELSKSDRDIIRNVEYIDDIPDDVVYRAFDGYSFVPEDFAAGAGDDWNAVY